MPLGTLKNDEFFAELERLNNTKSDDLQNKSKVIDMSQKGRKSGDNNVPEILRKVIAETAIEEGNKNTKVLTRAFGISDSSLSAYKNGATSTTSYHQPNQELNKTVTDTKTRIASKAKNRILKAIDSITQDKLEGSKAVDLSTIARNLSAVVKNIEPETPISQSGAGPTFIVYNPPQKREESFETIILKE